MPSWRHYHPDYLFSWRPFNLRQNYQGATETNRCSETNQISHSFARIQVGYASLRLDCIFCLLSVFFFSLVTENVVKCYAAENLLGNDNPRVSPSFLRLNYGFSNAIFSFFRERIKWAQKLTEGIILAAYKITCKISYLSITWNFGDTLI